MRISLFHLPLLIIIAGTLFLFAILDTNLVTQTASAAVTNGDTCSAHSECSSGYCYPGPENQKYCIARASNCARPGTDGVLFDTSYSYNGKTYACMAGNGLVEEATKVVNGEVCTAASQCSSGYCYPGPENQNYCIARDSHCARPDTNGILFGTDYSYNGKTYACMAGSGLIEKQTTKAENGEVCSARSDCASNYCYPGPENQNYCIARDANCAMPNTDGINYGDSYTHNGTEYSCVAGSGLVIAAAEPEKPSCTLTEERKKQIHGYLDQVVAAYTDRTSNPNNYPQIIYDIQELTASALMAGDQCGDVYILDQLAKLYSVPFSHMKEDPDGNWVWSNSTGYEEPLYSTQFMYATAKLINTIVSIDREAWTAAMLDFLSLPRQRTVGHAERWMNEKSMWTWKECGYETDYIREYTFPDYVNRKYERSLGYLAGAPHYCNALNDIELWTGAVTMELAAAEEKSHYWMGLSPQLKAQFEKHARDTTKLFESRISIVEAKSPLCSGISCQTAQLDVGGWHGHPEYPAELWPNGGEVWDFSHARRIVRFVDTMYSYPEVTNPTYSEAEIKRLFANAIAYLVWNGSYTDPSFANYLNGSNVQYRSYGPSELSASFFRAGYAFWAPYNVHLSQLVDSIALIVENNQRTTHLTPNGKPPQTIYDYLGFYSSLSTHESKATVSTEEGVPGASLVASVFEAFRGIVGWLLALVF